MALVRIMVDGYSLLEQWSGIAPGKPRHSETAREELINRLTQYFDSCGTPMTVIFGQPSPGQGVGPLAATPELEVVYAPCSQSGRQLMQRALRRLKNEGEVLVVTDEPAERQAAQAEGGLSASCSEFIKTVERALTEFEENLEHYNHKEQSKFFSH